MYSYEHCFYCGGYEFGGVAHVAQFALYIQERGLGMKRFGVLPPLGEPGNELRCG